MLLEEYFDFVDLDVIRIRGHRIGIEDVIDLYHQGYSYEQREPPEVVKRIRALQESRAAYRTRE